MYETIKIQGNKAHQLIFSLTDHNYENTATLESNQYETMELHRNEAYTSDTIATESNQYEAVELHRNEA